MFRHADTGAGIRKEFPVFPVGKPCIIAVFVGDGAVVYGFGASVADIRRFIEMKCYTKVVTGVANEI